MDASQRIDAALSTAMRRADGPGCPPGLLSAMRYAVFPGGHRIRPRLCLAVALAFPERQVPEVVDAALSSIEFLHCASLVHDDLPCFDDAAVRRGKAALHVRSGEPLALLAGDALIVLAFRTLTRAARISPERAVRLMEIIGDGVGAPEGIVAGQAWECEREVPLDDYHRAKTGALFAAATMAGAAAAGAEPAPWAALGEGIGRAYQIADDLLDASGSSDTLGKPVGQDARRDRPSAVAALGIDGAARHLRDVITAAVDSVPACPGEDALRALIAQEAHRFMSLALNGRAAA